MSETRQQTWLNTAENSCHMFTVWVNYTVADREMVGIHKKRLKQKLLYIFSHFFCLKQILNTYFPISQFFFFPFFFPSKKISSSLDFFPYFSFSLLLHSSFFFSFFFLFSDYFLQIVNAGELTEESKGKLKLSKLVKVVSFFFLLLYLFQTKPKFWILFTYSTEATKRKNEKKWTGNKSNSSALQKSCKQ